MVAVVEIANLQRPREKITVEYLAWFIENILGSQLRGITVYKTCTYVGSEVSKTCRSWLRGTRITRCVIYFCYFFGRMKLKREIQNTSLERDIQY